MIDYGKTERSAFLDRRRERNHVVRLALYYGIAVFLTGYLIGKTL